MQTTIDVAAQGILVQTNASGNGTFARRTIVAGTGVNVTNGNGAAGNITIAADPNAIITSRKIEGTNSSPVTAGGNFSVPHSFGVQTLLVAVYDVSIPAAWEIVDVNYTVSTSNITVYVASSIGASQYKVVAVAL